jgi:hypothetical protein
MSDGRNETARPPEQRRTEIVQRLLAEEPVEFTELAELDYDLHALWHLGLIAAGTGVQDSLRRAKADLGCQVLLAPCGDGMRWVWLGSSRKLKVTEVERLLSASQPAYGYLALGGLGRGLDGWRQTHREAKGALLRALRKPEKVVRYADGPLLVAALENDTLATWLKGFLSPLLVGPDGGARLLQTLRAYIDTGCNSSSAASKLGVRRHTVGSRRREAEDLLGCPLRTCLAELDVALRLVELESGGTGPTNVVGHSTILVGHKLIAG